MAKEDWCATRRQQEIDCKKKEEQQKEEQAKRKAQQAEARAKKKEENARKSALRKEHKSDAGRRPNVNCDIALEAEPKRRKEDKDDEGRLPNADHGIEIKPKRITGKTKDPQKTEERQCQQAPTATLGQEAKGWKRRRL